MSSTSQFEYPALYDTASDMSGESQFRYLSMVKGEYVSLISCAICSVMPYTHPFYYAVCSFFLLCSLCFFAARSWVKPEQDWYRGRALAESIKTSCWKYVMRAEPFGDADVVATRRAEFRSYLLAILQANRHIGDKMPPDKAARDQITSSMEKVRSLTLGERKAYYDTLRIRDQRLWYAKKASWNKKRSRQWMYVGFASYVVAVALSLLRIALPGLMWWPIEPLIVVASSILGWTQIKKFNELASSYTLTAHEIGILQGRISDVETEAEFSMFIVDAEQAFSREHTQWVARQQQS